MVESGACIHLRVNRSMAAALSPQKSRDLRVLMGTVPHECLPVPAASPRQRSIFVTVPISCSAEYWRHVGIAFAGVTPAEDPSLIVFLASGEGIGNAGNRPALFDDQQRQIIPNTLPLPLHAHFNVRNDFVVHFTARYRAISENMTPDDYSEVWFTLVYP